ncbi:MULTISPECIES: OmpA/MotB family protein [Rufibacter]|uniref:Chemotaxis protein MotB n=1 Tax=Rufibacter quisquiliarum TaxID=1549639 RepID=A0A839G7E7_9BACT|nr:MULTISPECIES: OmpA family protein [Rufibacter]MBA9075344.1 chemotaxis protein MotB [Rufibacter quisquiliarum]
MIKTRFASSALALVLGVSVLGSCVSSKKYKELEASKNALEQEKAAAQRSLEQANADLRDRDAKLAQYQQQIAQKERILNELKASVNSALAGFQEQGLTVNIKDGKVYVTMPEKLLFATGSTKVNPIGQSALGKLANAIKSQRDTEIMVEGHTDDVAVAADNVTYKDNWDLSVLRATEVTRLLINNGVPPQMVVPAGRGQFTPVAMTRTPEARQSNRRTEIILAPNFEKILQLLQNN